MVRSIGVWVAVAAGSLAGAIPASGQGTATAPGPRAGTTPVDGVVALVGDHPVLRSEVEEQLQFLAPQFQVNMQDSTQVNQLRREIVDNLINEQLLLLEAEAQGIKVEADQVTQAVEETIRSDRERLGDQGFAEQLQREGVTETELRSIYAEDLRKDFLRRQLIQKEVFTKIEVTEAAIEQHFKENREKIGSKPRALRVLDLFVRTKPDSVVEASYRKRAEEIREDLLAGKLTFEEAARQHSDDERSRDRGGLIGVFGPGDLGDRTFEQAAFDLTIGQVSEPIRTNLGYHLIDVMERDQGGEWAKVRHVLVKVTPSRSDEQKTRDRAAQIREQIASGKLDFAAAVRRYSDDPATREAGGDVGWLPITNFLGETKSAVETLRVGDVSPLAAVEGGFHIFKLTGEQAESEYALEEIRPELRAAIERDERQKRLETYLTELRGKTYVEVRPLQ
jgi:peptidyl-prolyl cis-trans isomerase SurA